MAEDKKQPTSRMEKRIKARRIEKLLFTAAIIAALILGFFIGRMSIGGDHTADDPKGTAPVPTATQVPDDISVDEPTGVPTYVPTDAPTDAPTDVPTDAPTDVSTDAPTDAPTDVPTDAPTDAPTGVPTDVPTDAPEGSEQPTETQEPVVPANPMSQSETAHKPETDIIEYRPLKNADRIRIAMNRDELPLYGIRIGIDPGHQRKGNNEKEPVSPGSSEMKAKVSSGTQGVATRVPEYVVNLDVSLKLRDALEALGAEVYLTRDTHDIDISNVERAVMMNELEVDMVLRIHCNGSENQSTNGISLFVKSTGAGAEESYAICEALMPAMLDATGARSAGIYKRDTYSGMNWSTVPSILVEMGFMSNPEEDRLLNDAEYQQKLVDGMVQGIADYMGRSLEPTAGENADADMIGE